MSYPSQDQKWSNRRRCLIVGTTGQLGRALVSVFSKTENVLTAVRHPVKAGDIRIDLSETSALGAVLEKISPDWILIAGAFVNVDRCEQEPLLCRRVNVEGTREIVRYASRKGSFVVYYSTDHVFDGTHSPYAESDPVHPLNVYSQSKVDGEAVVREALPDRHLILRTSWLYGPDVEERNFPLRLIKRVREGESVSVPVDQWGSPTFTEDLAGITHFLATHAERGTFHACGPEYVNRYDYACRIAHHFGLRKELIIPVSTVQLRQSAPRALKIQLNCQKLEQLGAPAGRSIEEGLMSLKTWWSEDDKRSPCFHLRSNV